MQRKIVPGFRYIHYVQIRVLCTSTPVSLANDLLGGNEWA